MQLVTYDQARQLLASRTMISSNFGAVLERARDGVSANQIGRMKKQQEDEERRRLRDAFVIRCIDDLFAYKSIRFAWCPDLRKFAQRAHLRDGEAVVRVLRAYEPWATQWPEKGLVEAYTWMRTHDRRLQTILTEDGETAAQAFRMGHSRRARACASSAVADAHVALHTWVALWSRKPHELEAGNAAE